MIGERERQELMPHGILRVGIAVGAARSTVWARRNEESGKPEGVTVDLGAALADFLGVPFQMAEHSSSADIVAHADKDVWDVTFVPVDAERKALVSFGTNYHLGDSTYLVRASSPYRGVADLNRPDATIAGIEGTATLRSARRAAPNANIVGAAATTDVIALFEAGKADGIALGRESLRSLELPGTRILDDYFHATGTAVAVPLGRPMARDIVTNFIETAKTNGALRRIFNANGMAHVEVAPEKSVS
jgi:polar amino acid transport system substrate-binding protein